MLPKTLYIGEGGSSGVDITYTKTRRSLRIGGWYDDFVGIEGQEMPLGQFLMMLGITEKDIKKSLQEVKGEV